MLWYSLESILTLPLLYAIVGTVVEFRYGRRRCLAIVSLAVCVTVGMDYLLYTSTGSIYAYAWISTGIPGFLSLFYLARHRDGSFVFAYLTECVLASFATMLSHIFAYLLSCRHPLCQVLIHTALLAAALVVCRRLFCGKIYEAVRVQGKRWILYCLMPVLCLMIWAIFANSPARLFDIENKVNIPYVGYIYPQNIPALIVLLSVIIYMAFLIFVNIRSTYQAEMERQEKVILDFQSRALGERLSDLEEKDESLRILRHDMRHHVSTLSGLMGNKEYIRAQEYLKQLERNLALVKQQSYCSNAVINAILSFYAENAQRMGIRFSHHIEISDHLPVDDMDIGTVLSNALENALNACMRQPTEAERFIDIKFIRHKMQFVLDISNSFDGNVEFDSSGRPVSITKDHGIGSQSIFAFARKYGATIDYAAEDRVFNIRIMFTDTVTG